MFERFQAIVNSHISRAIAAPAINYSAIITIKGVTLTVLKVRDVIHTSNFVGAVSTISHLTLAVPTSQMRLLTTRANGNMNVKVLTLAGKQVLNTMNYNGIVVGTRDPDMESPTMFLSESNDKSIGILTLELMPASLWYQRLKNVGGIYQATDGLTLLRKLLVDTLPNQKEEAGIVHSIQYEQEEQQLYRNIVIPDSMTFLEVFDYIQDKYGVYAKGLGVFQYFNNWFLFQPYDETKFNKAGLKLVVMNLPRERAAQIDRTLHSDANVRYLITGGDTLTEDTQDQNALNEGTGYRVGTLRALDGRSSSFTAGGVSKTTSDTFVSQAAPNTHASGLVNAPVSKKHFADHDKDIRSKLAARDGRIVKVTWNQSMPNIVYPGMPVKFMYANDVGMYTRYGTVLGEVYHAAVDGQTLASSRFNSTTELTLWLSNSKITN
ncbi:hypothetical protein pEaSNUABM11_00077 [Erwinia phage pEa_SNUABM_11]|nr:hypothetical protein pEaSNUABM11_00077 [Erwinia phage pEa_SNUABM_11]